LRSFDEIQYRLRQEASNVWLLVRQPVFRKLPGRDFPILPNPEAVVPRLRGTEYAAELIRLADLALQHQVRLLDRDFDLPPAIDWRCDYMHGIRSGLAYFRRIPYLDAERVGDHKIVWELNRHQHLVLLAQAFRLNGRESYLTEIQNQLRDWTTANPFLRGMNWASALEVAFRALSWIWIYRLAGAEMPEEFLREWLTGIYRHGLYLEANLSVYFSPNTHLLGEAVALHALGAAFPDFAEAARWRETGHRVAAGEMERQVREDGSHFEQSSYYHVYALDFFLLHYLLAGGTEGYRAKLVLMADYLDALMGTCRTLPFLGDDDGGRVFHPYGPRDLFGRATLATCAAVLDRTRWRWDPGDLYEQAAWWVGESAFAALPPRIREHGSRLFRNAGVCIMEGPEIQVIADAGSFGFGRGGHSHSDTLSVIVRAGNERILEDPGTYTYASGSSWRDRMRGSAAHNTIRIDGLDQATPAGLFGWIDKPAVAISEWTTAPERDYLDAQCRYAGFTHRRRMVFARTGVLFILDEVDGPEGEHVIEQFWHPGAACVQMGPACFSIGAHASLVLDGAAQASIESGGDYGWLSPVLCEKRPAPVIRARAQRPLPALFAAALRLTPAQRRPVLRTLREGPEIKLTLDGDESVQTRFRAGGSPVLIFGFQLE
jgi:hypothetical protein